MCSPGSPKVDTSVQDQMLADAQRARQEEEARQGRIRAGTVEIDRIFNGGTTGTGRVQAGAAYNPNQVYYLKDGTVWKPPAPTAPAPAVQPKAPTSAPKPGIDTMQGTPKYGAPKTTQPKQVNLLGMTGMPTSGAPKPGTNGNPTPTPAQPPAPAPAAPDPFAEAVKNGLFTGTQKTTGFDKAFYKKFEDSFTKLYMPDLTEQFGDAKDDLTFALARAGTLKSSVAGDKTAKLNTNFANQKASITSKAKGAVSDLKTQVANEKSNLISLLNSTGDQTSAVKEALARSATLFQKQPEYNPLGDIFAGAASGIGSAVAGRQNEALMRSYFGNRRASDGRVVA